MGTDHQLAEGFKVILLKHFDGFQNAINLFHNVLRSATNCFVWDQVFIFVKLLKVQLTKQRDVWELLLQVSNRLLALASSLIVSGVDETSAFVRVADH
ncbi:hypothetical protein D3C85_1114880 [compost metagenome]